jgi:hypothetical protein
VIAEEITRARRREVAEQNNYQRSKRNLGSII